MSFGATKLLSASGGKAYEIDQSLMFNNGDVAHLKRTPSSASNRRTWTFSTWLKNGSTYYTGGSIWTSHDNSTQSDAGYGWIGFYQDGLQVGGWSTNWRVTNKKFRDFSAWMHIVVAIDTTIADGSADNRVRVYINGVEETSFSTKNNPSQNYELAWNRASFEHQLGGTLYTNPYSFGGYLAETHFIDGTQLTPSSFGETDSETGQWIPKKYTGGSYGTNGFYLKYVSGALGTDSSGEGNNYTATNLANSDVMLDAPTNNFCTLNLAQAYNTTTGVLTQGNLFFAAGAYSSGHYSNISSTFNVPASGKWYVECRVSIEAGSGNAAFFGVVDQNINWLGVANENLAGADGLFNSLYLNYIKVCDSGSVGTGNTSATATSYIFGMALDVDNGYAYFGVDSGSAMVWYQADGSTSGGDPTSGSTGTGGFARTFTTNDTITVSTAISGGGGDGSQNHLNFGQNGTFCGTETAGGNADGNGRGNFFRSPPSGYLALCSQNLPTPTIKKSTENFNTVLWTGDGASTRSITGVGFQADWSWIKARTASYSHLLYDAVRGAGASKALKSNSNVVEGENDNSTYGYLSAFASDGLSLVHGSDAASFVNQNTITYVAWNWKAGGASPSKTYAVKVVSDSGNKYRFDDYGTSAVTLNLQEGGTYTFDQSDSSNATHPLRFSTTSDGSHGGGSEYTTGVTTNGTPGSSGAYTTITVAASAPTLYYYCTAHSGMGGQVNTNSTFGATNLDGSSLSIVSENTTSGFSVVSYTGTGANATVGHELGVAPSVIILKNRDTDDNWRVYSRNDATDYLALNATIASTDDNTTWNDTAPTSSVFTVGTDTNANRSGDDFIAYCFANVEGFFKSGTYTGNGQSENGPVVTTSFSPALVIVKEASSAGGSWFMWDNKRETFNVRDLVMWADGTYQDTAHAEYEIDFLSNGFKLRGNSAASNQNGETMLYMAWAESPFKYATAR